MRTFVVKVAIKKLKLNNMFKITNKKTGHFYYLNADQTATFMFRNDVDKYSVKEIRSINIEEIKWALIGLILMVTFMCGIIYYATNE